MSLNDLFNLSINNINNSIADADSGTECYNIKQSDDLGFVHFKNQFVGFRSQRKSKVQREIDAFIERYGSRDSDEHLREALREAEEETERASVEAYKASSRRGYELVVDLSIAQMTQGNKETMSANPHIIAAFKDFLMADGDDTARTEVLVCDAVEAFESDDEGNTSMDEEYLHMLDELPASPTYFRSARAEKASKNFCNGQRPKFARNIGDSVAQKQSAKTQGRVIVTRDAAEVYREALALTLFRCECGSLPYFRHRKYLRREEKLQVAKARELNQERQLIEYQKELERMRTELPKLSPKKAEPKPRKAPKTCPMVVTNGIPYPKISAFGENPFHNRMTFGIH